MDYITKEDTIIFSPKFNKIIDKKLLANYKKVIFSDFELTDDLFDNYKNDNLFDNYENDNYKYSEYIGSEFNREIDLPQNLTHLTFGNDFNQKVDLPHNLTHLTFGNNFNQKVNLETNLTHLTFGLYFNQKVDLPPNLTHLIFGNWFNQKVDLPQNLTHLTLDWNFNQKVDLPWNLKYLYLYCKKTTSIIDYLPDSLEELKLGYYFNDSLDNLPISLKTLKISDEYDKNKLKNLPKNVQVIYY